ncbi:coiled-coil-helix-coiled-coil-helix domain-containing protein 7-like [Mya arenaria]|uniref:coiled-coil-helix-coiled-coil-helix domain-containing protein 7-like n=1 Tax=Mya arenaria TaxID=6604 RepID=UPI0022DFA394|nr:coiled-coil-helix-coiled-coil-helix domain-containing protein 7-like [Mya arenaria]
MSTSEGEKMKLRAGVKEIQAKLKMGYGEDSDPCYKEGRLVMACKAMGQSKDECKELALNVKRCRKFWVVVKADRMKKGISPALPKIQDRPAVMEEYKDTLEKIRQKKSMCVIQ